MVTEHRPPFVFTVQVPPASSIPLPPESVEFESVNVMLPLSQSDPSGDQSQHSGSVVSGAAKTVQVAERTAMADTVISFAKILSNVVFSLCMFGRLGINAHIVSLMGMAVKSP